MKMSDQKEIINCALGDCTAVEPRTTIDELERLKFFRNLEENALKMIEALYRGKVFVKRDGKIRRATVCSLKHNNYWELVVVFIDNKTMRLHVSEYGDLWALTKEELE